MDCLAEPGEMLGSCPDQSTEYCLLNENTEQASFASGMYRSESIWYLFNDTPYHALQPITDGAYTAQPGKKYWFTNV